MQKKSTQVSFIVGVLLLVGNAGFSAEPVAPTPSPQSGQTEMQKESFEKQAVADIEAWEKKVNEIREVLKKTPMTHKHHRHLKRAARHLESDLKNVKQQLSKMKSSKDWQHYEDHIKAEFEDMKVTYDKRLAD